MPGRYNHPEDDANDHRLNPRARVFRSAARPPRTGSLGICCGRGSTSGRGSMGDRPPSASVPDATAPPAPDFAQQIGPLLHLAHRVALRLSGDCDLAEDLVQEAALRAFVHYGQFKPGTNFRAWFIRIPLNCFRCHWRRASRLRSAPAIRGRGRISSARSFSRLNETREVRGATVAMIAPPLMPILRAGLGLLYIQLYIQPDATAMRLRQPGSAGTGETR